MNHIMPRVSALSVAALLFFGHIHVAQAQEKPGGLDIEPGVVYRARMPARLPAPKAEKPSPAPSANAIRIDGYWDLQGDPMSATRGGWVWVPGRWELPPFPHAHWDPGHWGYLNEWWSWIPGHWVDRAAPPNPDS